MATNDNGIIICRVKQHCRAQAWPPNTAASLGGQRSHLFHAEAKRSAAVTRQHKCRHHRVTVIKRLKGYRASSHFLYASQRRCTGEAAAGRPWRARNARHQRMREHLSMLIFYVM